MGKILERKNIVTLEPYTSARDLYKEGVFLDANENYTQWVRIDWSKIPVLNRYPDSTCDDLREKLVENYITGFTKENIFVGCGSDEIINLLIEGFVEDGEAVMVMDPSYSFYEVQADIKNKKTKKILLSNNFSLNIKEIKKKIKTVKIIFLCSPNNPTGTLITKEEIQAVLQFFEGIIVVDEAYIEFAGKENSLVDLVSERRNIVILRTFSKAWGLAAIRVGYAVGPKSIIGVLLKIKESYNVSSISQNIVMQALDQVKKLQRKVKEMKRLKQKLLKDFSTLGVKTSDTSANFILIKYPFAQKIYEKLADKKMIIRDRSDMPLLSNTLRITVGSEEENNKLIKLLKPLIKKNDFDGIIFDMDGVIIDVSKSYRETIRQTASYFLGREVGKDEVDRIKSKEGMNNDWDATYALINNKKIPYDVIKDYFQLKYLGDGKTRGLFLKEKLLIPKVQFQRLKNKYRKLGIATGRPKKEALLVLRNFGLTQFFPEENIIAMEDTKEGKPNPAPLLLAKEKMGVINPVYIGDTISDVVASKQANMFCIFVGKEKAGDLQIDNISNLKEILL